MGKWKQVSGDMSWDSVGCVLARVDKGGRQVELVRIEPWLEMDSSAIGNGYGLWQKSSGYVDYDDMGVDRDDVQSALNSVGMDAAEYKKLAPEHKAEIIASYGGVYEDDGSFSDLLKMLPDKPENIEFWHGKETTDKVEGYNAEMRREAVDKLYGNDYSFGEVPDDEVLELAFGDAPLSFELGDNGKSGLGYALLFKGRNLNLDVDNRKDVLTIKDAGQLGKILEALAAAPKGEGLVPADQHKVERYLGYELNATDEDDKQKFEEMADELAESSHELAKEIMGELGFNWS